MIFVCPFYKISGYKVGILKIKFRKTEINHDIRMTLTPLLNIVEWSLFIFNNTFSPHRAAVAFHVILGLFDLFQACDIVLWFPKLF